MYNSKLSFHQEKGFRFFDFYFSTIVPIFIIVRFLSIFGYIELKFYFSAFLMLVSTILNIIVMLKFRPYKKLTENNRRYPKHILYIIVGDNFFLILNYLVYVFLNIIKQNFQNSTKYLFSSIVYIFLSFYFIKRKNVFKI